MESWVNRISFRKRIFIGMICLLPAFCLSACQSGEVAYPPSAPSAPPQALTGEVSPALYTYPPALNNGAIVRFGHYGLEQGLSQSSAQVILQDAMGFLWVGTQDGLDRFDGYAFKVFRADPKNPNALSNSYISTLAQGSKGVIWIGTYGGLNRYDPVNGKFIHYLHDENNPDSLSDDTVRAVYEDPQGMLWIGTAGGLDVLDPITGKFTHVKMPDGLPANGNLNSINTLYKDSFGVLWVGTGNGLIRIEAAGQTPQLYKTDASDNASISFNDVSSIVEGRNGVLWVGTSQGLNQLDRTTGRFTRFLHNDLEPASLANSQVISAYVDRAGEFWVGTRYGLDRYNEAGRDFIHFRNDPLDPSSLSNNTIDSIYEDRGGVLWIGTDDGGLNEYDRGLDQFALYHHVTSDPFSLSGNIILPILPLSNGKIWIGTDQAGLNLFDPSTGRSQHFQHDRADPDSLTSDTIYSLLLDHDGSLWIGTSEGLDRLDPGSSKFIHYVPNTRNPDSLPFGPVYSIYQDNQLTYWVGTSQGVRIFNPSTALFSQLNIEDKSQVRLSSDAVRAIYQDRSGIMWFGTAAHGLFRYDPITQQTNEYRNNPNANNSLSNNTIFDVYQDHVGRIWVATDEGLDRLIPRDNGFEHFLVDRGLPNNVVYGILEDPEHNLWLSTNFGISKFDPSTQTFVNFTVDDGLQSNEFNSASFAEDAQGRMYFGGEKGLTVFYPSEIHKYSYVPPVVITTVTAQETPSANQPEAALAQQVVVVSYPQNSFDFSFAALSFSQTSKNQYDYLLEGFDQSWHVSGSDHHASYTNLPGGSYTLHVRGSSKDGVWNEAGAEVRITVIPPFWQTWPFRTAAGMLLVVAFVLAYQWRVRGIRMQRMELAEIIQNRTHALNKRNRDLEALYSADEKMLRVLTLDRVLQALVDVAVDILEADKSAVLTQTKPRGEFSVRVSRGFQPETVQCLNFGEDTDIVFLARETGALLTLRNTPRDPKWEYQSKEILDRMDAEHVQSLMYIPIKIQNTILGIFCVGSAQLGEFDEDRQRLFVSLVQRAALSVENIQLFDQTKYLAVLEERNRLARELHDSAKQKAFAALAQLGTAKRLVKEDQEGVKKYVAEAENIVSEVIRDLTTLIQELYPKDLKEKGLATSLRNYAYEWETRSAIHLNLIIAGERALPLEMEQALSRIVHEGLSNIARHSQATQADIGIVYHEDEIEIQISDNGQGFDLQQPGSGLGLRLIQDRTGAIGGQVVIRSGPGQGTQLTIRVPVQARE